MRSDTFDTTQLGDIRTQVLRQHAEIRARLRGIDRTAIAAGKRDALVHLRVSLAHFAALFDEHLSFEERALGPILRGLDSWGPVREAALFEEHIEQRKRVEAACALAEDATSGSRELAGEVHWLIETLTEDMDREELELGRLMERARLEGTSTDQMTG